MNIKNYNDSELQLASFLEFKKYHYTTMCLSPQGDNTIIEKMAINKCTVTIEGKEYVFGGISEKVYDELVREYDCREYKAIKRLKVTAPN